PPCRPASTTRTAEAFCPNDEWEGPGSTHDPGPSRLSWRIRIPGWATREDRARTGARNHALRENPERALKPAIYLELGALATYRKINERVKGCTMARWTIDRSMTHALDGIVALRVRIIGGHVNILPTDDPVTFE